jgi:hypothetical protein
LWSTTANSDEEGFWPWLKGFGNAYIKSIKRNRYGKRVHEGPRAGQKDKKMVAKYAREKNAETGQRLKVNFFWPQLTRTNPLSKLLEISSKVRLHHRCSLNNRKAERVHAPVRDSAESTFREKMANHQGVDYQVLRKASW